MVNVLTRLAGHLWVQPWVQPISWLVWVENANGLGWDGVKQNWCGLG
jgi:hypothetical protein